MGPVGQTLRYQQAHGLSARVSPIGMEGTRPLRPETGSVPGNVSACCIMGFWGVPNFGDEWLFRAAQAFLRERSRHGWAGRYWRKWTRAG